MKKLNFGCGMKIKEGYVNVDITKGEGIDKSFDFEKYPYPFKDDTFDFVYMRGVLEHLIHPLEALKELHRIMKPNAVIEILVPHVNSSLAFACITHHHYFTKKTFKRLSRKDYLLGNYYEVLSVECVPTKLGRLFPSFMRKTLSEVFNGIYCWIHAELKVNKKH